MKDANDLALAGALPADPTDPAHVGPPQPLTPTRGPRPVGELSEEAFSVMVRRASGEEKPVATPWPAVNDVLRGGLWPGLYTLTSATGMGKTQWALQVTIPAAMRFLEEAAQTGRPLDRIRYVALELGGVDLIARALGILAAEHLSELQAHGYTRSTPPPWSDLFFGRDRHGNLIPEDLTRTIAAFGSTLRTLPLDIETGDAIGWNYLDLRRVAEPSPGGGRVRLIVLDYSQLVSAPEGRAEELRQTIGNVAKVGRDLARRLGCAVLALSSTARVNYDSVAGKANNGGDPAWLDDPASLIALGKESGELEYTADVVLALARRCEGEVHLCVAKGRGLPTGTAPLSWDGHLFRDMNSTVALQTPKTSKVKR